MNRKFGFVSILWMVSLINVRELSNVDLKLECVVYSRCELAKNIIYEKV